jgi:drug/metabolite transporter (DMT)-like permease
MENFLASTLLIGVLAFGILMASLAIQERFPSLEGRKTTNMIQNIAIWILLICGLSVIATLLIAYLNQPSAFEKCMEATINMIDPQAIAWMEDYCASQ